MFLIQLLAAALSSVAIAASPLPGQEAITNDQGARKACVFGSPKHYEQWTIYYQDVKPPSQFPNRFILDPAWVALHQTVGDADVRIAQSIFPEAII